MQDVAGDGSGGDKWRWRQWTQEILRHVEDVEPCPKECSAEGRVGMIGSYLLLREAHRGIFKYLVI